MNRQAPVIWQPQPRRLLMPYCRAKVETIFSVTGWLNTGPRSSVFSPASTRP